MSADVTPYLSFRGQAREAMELYASVFGGTLTVSAFSEFGGMGLPEEEQGQVMHSQLDVDGKPLVMGADTPSTMPYEAPTSGVTIALTGDDEATLRRWWDALADEGTIHLPLELAPWGDYFGQLSDKYGVSWMVNCAGPDNQPGSQPG